MHKIQYIEYRLIFFVLYKNFIYFFQTEKNMTTSTEFSRNRSGGVEISIIVISNDHGWTITSNICTQPVNNTGAVGSTEPAKDIEKPTKRQKSGKRRNEEIDEGTSSQRKNCSDPINRRRKFVPEMNRVFPRLDKTPSSSDVCEC